MECQFDWEKELLPNSRCRIICGKVKHISISEDFAHSSPMQRYGKDSFMFHLMMKDPFTGENLPSGVGHIEVTRETDL